jgi:hypothetical protein
MEIPLTMDTVVVLAAAIEVQEALKYNRGEGRALCPDHPSPKKQME